MDNGKVVARETSAATENAPVVLKVKKAKLWSPDSPFLYDLSYEVLDHEGRVIDKVYSYTGMRKIHAEGNRLYLNNRPLYLRMVLDQGYYPESQWTAPSDSALRNDILLAKAAGFNGARLHQKVFEERFHYWADKLGYLTCGEMNSWGLDYNLPLATSIFLPEWMEIVKRDRNHPSIIMWVPLNEQNNVDKRYFPRFSAQLYDATKLVDSTRPVLARLVGQFRTFPSLSLNTCLSNSVAKSCQSFCQSSMVKSLVCSGDGLSSILMTEFFTGRKRERVSCIEFQTPIASGSDGIILSNTR